ncbi:hypothetical protein JCM11641_006072 [Rhodosporidiobolus odoratus]
MTTLTSYSLKSMPRCFATASIGQPTDSLPTRLAHLSHAGFTQIELAFPDLLTFASQLSHREVGEKDWSALEEAASEVKKVCEGLGLQVYILQPFGKFEGWREGSEERREVWERVEGWVGIMKAVGTRTLQVGSSDAEGIDTSCEAVVKDLRLLCDKLKEADPSFRVAYENWCWSSHAPTSQAVWEIVEAVDRDNIGLCLDTFQHAGAVLADPTKEDGLIASTDREEAYRKSLEQLRQIPPDKIIFLQISDAYKVTPPLEDKTVDSLRPRGRWSHDYRPFPFATSSPDGYLPVVEITKAVLETGFRGTLSMEVFDGGIEGKGAKDRDLKEYAKEGMRSLDRLLEEVEKA